MWPTVLYCHYTWNPSYVIRASDSNDAIGKDLIHLKVYLASFMRFRVTQKWKNSAHDTNIAWHHKHHELTHLAAAG